MSKCNPNNWIRKTSNFPEKTGIISSDCSRDILSKTLESSKKMNK